MDRQANDPPRIYVRWILVGVPRVTGPRCKSEPLAVYQPG